MKIRVFLLILVLGVLGLSCGDGKPAKNAASKPAKAAGPEVKTGVAPVADSEIAVIEMENSSAYGTIKIELYSNIAPKMVARFKE